MANREKFAGLLVDVSRIFLDYCIKNNIPLIRIPYYKLNTLELKDLEITTTNFLLKRSDE